MYRKHQVALQDEVLQGGADAAVAVGGVEEEHDTQERLQLVVEQADIHDPVK